MNVYNVFLSIIKDNLNNYHLQMKKWSNEKLNSIYPFKYGLRDDFDDLYRINILG